MELTLPDRLVRNVQGVLGLQAASAWLGRLPSIVEHCSQAWSLSLGPLFPDLSYNFVAPATLCGGEEAVLKVCIPGPEFKTEAEALATYDGEGLARLLAVDFERSALLIERLRPGRPLSALADDDRAMDVAAAVMRRIRRPAPDGSRFPSMALWLQHMAERGPRLAAATPDFPAHWLERAAGMAEDLARGAAEPVLLHGDLHQDNILSAGREPWLAIDPKGVIGEPAWEAGPLFFNVLPPGSDSRSLRGLLARRLSRLAAALAIDRERLAAATVVRCVLSAYWSLEDGGNWGTAIACAEALGAA